MMAQYLEIKARAEDALLFYRMGDFYELFFDDAVHAAAALDIALTKRGKHLGDDIPMCGVPVHASDSYLQQLIRSGFRVAVCEQMEDPAEAKKRGYKAVVKRDIVRLVTPGTLTEDSLLDARSANHLTAWAEIRGAGALAWIDMSTGDLTVTETSRAALGPSLARIAPKEVLIVEDMWEDDALAAQIRDAGAAVTPLSRASFDSQSSEARLKSFFRIDALDAFGAFTRPELSALGALLDYVELTQVGKAPLVKPPLREVPGGIMRIDAATRRNLELTRTLSGEKKGALLEAIDRTVTGAGARLLERRLSSPATDPSIIAKRAEAVEALVENPPLREALTEALRRAPEIERALTRLSLDRGGPRDLTALREGLRQAGALSATLTASLPADGPVDLLQAVEALAGHEDAVALLESALIVEPPLLARDGGYVAETYDAELDEARALRDQGRGVIASLQARYAEATGIASLKVKHNNVLGYFIETPAKHAERMMAPPLSEDFIHRQTMANAVRFTTVELSELETKILNAGGRALRIEQRIFAELCAAILDRAPEIGNAARALARVDVAAGLATLAADENWTRPEIAFDRDFVVRAGRHPVVERALRREGGGPFIANDCDLTADASLEEGGSPKPVWLLTGPNMAGKSTFLRQNALIAILAQMGAFVPASFARIGVVDQLFSRVGAADDLARGRSTFMVEMVETAAILNQAGPRALVILDEIGRGTATYDGLSIAWATLEHLHDVNDCRALFATHYHELTALAGRLDGLKNATVAVREWEGEIVFLHEVRDGAADRSYGVQVAKLAGLPAPVIARARDVLEALESSERDGGRAEALIDDLPLFSAPPPSAPTPKSAGPSAAEARLAQLNPDAMTPREALDALYELRAINRNPDESH